MPDHLRYTSQGRCWLLAAAAVISLSPAYAADRYLLIGGGPSPREAQVSIETSIIQTQQMLRQLGLNDGMTLFGTGRQLLPDVMLQDDSSHNAQHWRPLARLFDREHDAGYQFRHNIVQPDGAFDRISVTRTLVELLKPLRDGDSLLLIYSGHGGQVGHHPSGSSLRLLHDESLSAHELARLLDRSLRGATLRALLPQCFSGGFATLLFHTPEHPDVDAIHGNRCGFFSVAADRTAEGCTPSINSNDYRDYTTYFIGALSGATLAPVALRRDPDSDGNGVTTLLEAHEHAYIVGLSTDVPRASSEHYLEQWAPWYIDLLPERATPLPSRYARIARQLGAALNLGDDWRALPYAAETSRQHVAENQKRLKQQRRTLTDEARMLQRTLRRQLLRRWPVAAHPYSADYALFLQRDAETTLLWLTSHSAYANLLQLDQKIGDIDRRILNAERLISYHDRLLRMIRLTHINNHFVKLASRSQQENYNSLIACESWSPSLRVANASRPAQQPHMH